ncbi:SpaH/EbpB family LPXTG-anchored major pilin [Corynebacterium kutscheri]|uniref:Surface-anchored fimbrial subunit n=1 Tax=Corynebacterium kutscheri TaxID=35755 RepID=A0AB38VR26_9CORY|nr:SpaH/EbpB family LPXTG-anchored major pilin [Corynebacterium kutscheri]VEH06005.1 putative surface-anchored fimbrial subunit [Corynebacterium kutscheri]
MRADKTSIGRRVIASLGVVALLASGSFAPVSAEESLGGAGAAQNNQAAAVYFGNVDKTKKGSVTIHKHEHQDGSKPAVVGNHRTGEYTGTPAEGIDGVKFTYFKLGLDLSTQAGWDALQNYGTPPNACTGDDLSAEVKQKFPQATKVGTVTTANGGKADVTGLDVDAYLFCETDAPADVVDRAAPFIVTIPFPDTAENQQNLPTPTNAWLYDVHVFPKNGKTKLGKTVEQQEQHGLSIGSEVRFPVTAQVPRIADGNVFKHFYIVDPMDPRFAQDSLGVESVTLNNLPLTLDTDYKVTVTGSLVTVSFTQSGLTKLKLNPGTEVKAIFKGKLERLDHAGLDAGKIKNRAYVYSDTEPKPGDDNPPAEPPTTPPTTPPLTPPPGPTPPGGTPEVNTFWGDLTLKKVDAGDSDTPLEGAKFKVYPAAIPYPATADQCSKDYGNNSAIKKAGTTGEDLEAISDKDGKVEFKGLFVSDDQNDPKSKEFRCYVVVETEAPAGFVTPQGENAKFAVAVKIGKNAEGSYDLTVKNNKRDTPDLPLTGGQGVALMLIAGGILMIIAVGSGFVFVRRMRG